MNDRSTFVEKRVHDSPRVRRAAILYTHLGAYTAACLRKLKAAHDVDLLIYSYAVADEAPYDQHLFDGLGTCLTRDGQTVSSMLQRVRSFEPDAAYVAGWTDDGYLAVARELRKDGVPVVSGCDRHWNGTLRQRLGQLVAPWYLHTAIDAMWVPGERQRQLAGRLGYRGDRCWSGIYCCDWERFAEAYHARQSGAQDQSEPHFLYVGRYVEAKGLDVLAEAYDAYRREAAEPWPLVCVGTGPEGYRLKDIPGVVDRGFVQPDDLPGVMADAAAFVLPSRHEPWGVVVQEAAATGLPLICTDACGAAVHLLQDRYNGLLVSSGSPSELTRAMLRMSTLDRSARRLMAARSHELSKQFTPDRWAMTFVDGVRQLTTTSSVLQD